MLSFHFLENPNDNSSLKMTFPFFEMSNSLLRLKQVLVMLFIYLFQEVTLFSLQNFYVRELKLLLNLIMTYISSIKVVNLRLKNSNISVSVAFRDFKMHFDIGTWKTTDMKNLIARYHSFISLIRSILEYKFLYYDVHICILQRIKKIATYLIF